MLNGVTHLAMMKADVMDNLDQICVCTRYDIEGTVTEKVTFESVNKVEPIYETMQGWNTGIRGCPDKDQLPEHFRDYLHYIEENLKLPVAIISLGPGREDTLIVADI
jgi:adenylosuccinate synthase